MKVYLGGSIKGKNFDEANRWRNFAAGVLTERGHEAINPLRGRVWNSADEQEQFSMNEIIHRDLHDVDRSDCLLVEYTEPTKYGYVGTITEMARARMQNKIVVVFTKNGVEEFGWLSGYLATKIFSEMQDALDYIVGVLG